jgi:hypothetical protein
MVSLLILITNSSGQALLLEMNYLPLITITLGVT